ncbi:hypothetical protein C2M08_06205 [Klebsiella pneumoniae]|nr:DUF2002 family protein [Klebsiella pneumoniae subsp. pneumoniae]PKT18927.1 hypothetical protein CYD75_21525 [Klebsiella pneumoniae]QAW60492.1 hypothetical protein C2L61_06215 [Klebsiella pneumoniae]QAW66252.1 hypothetical protein C2L62_06235 [Klebsiella pneumoniae]QAW77500.1 hypothetical protein C2M08_06205 [Klebsiella pneumoniae]
MYLRPDEVARVLEKAGFTMDVVTQKAYGYRRGDNYVYVNREARMGRTALGKVRISRSFLPKLTR